MIVYLKFVVIILLTCFIHKKTNYFHSKSHNEMLIQSYCDQLTLKMN